MGETSFSEAQRAALTGVLDAIIPRSADGTLPGAGELGLAATVEEQLGAVRPLIARGLEALDELARQRGAESFAALAAAARPDVLNEHAASDPGFLPGLVFQTYTAYYLCPRVVEALGIEDRPPHPRGYRLEQADLDSLLENVRRGPKRYREV